MLNQLITKQRVTMENKKLHSVVGLFSTPDSIIHAAEKTTEKGYKHYDVNTPYPVHGMDTAMKLKPSTMGYFALAFGLTGTAVALSFMYWVFNIAYPMNIGGKPDFPLPALIPITFELTVLFAAIGTVLSLLFVFFKMPDNSNPLHDTEYMKHCTSDMFGLCIESEDKLFNEAEVKEFLAGLGATNIESVYYPKVSELPIFTKNFIIFLLCSAIVISGAVYFVTNKLMFMTPYNWMLDQDKISAQAPSNFFKDGFGMRESVNGTVPRNFIPEEYQASPDSAGTFLVNPLDKTDAVIAKGKAAYNTFCSPCHGNYAKGDSRLRGLFPNPPTLHSKKVRNWPDGRLYHVITFGQNVMPSYAKQLSRDERWAVINYIRTLQRAFNPKEEDFNESK